MDINEVLLKQYINYPYMESIHRINLELCGKIAELIENRDRVIIGIDGNCAAGKSTLAEMLHGIYDCNVFHMDDYFLRPEQRTEERLNEIGGNVDYERFHQEILQGIDRGDGVHYRAYNCQMMALEPEVILPARKLNIIEGAYSIHPYLSEYYDLKIFLPLNYEEQLSRIRKRNGEQMLRRFIGEWIPKENQYFQKFSIMEQCDIVYRED